MQKPHCDGAHFKRRDFLRAGALSFLGIGLSDFFRQQMFVFL